MLRPNVEILTVAVSTTTTHQLKLVGKLSEVNVKISHMNTPCDHSEECLNVPVEYPYSSKKASTVSLQQ
jgi:hypothetical protein